MLPNRTWGEQLSLNIGLGFIFGLPMLMLIAGGVWAVSAKQPVLLVATIAIGVILIASLSLLSNTLNATIRAAVYAQAGSLMTPLTTPESGGPCASANQPATLRLDCYSHPLLRLRDRHSQDCSRDDGERWYR